MRIKSNRCIVAVTYTIITCRRTDSDIVMDGCVVESNSIIAAGAVVLEGTHVPAGTIFAGVPAKKVKDISEALIHGEINRIANNYVMYASWYK